MLEGQAERFFQRAMRVLPPAIVDFVSGVVGGQDERRHREIQAAILVVLCTNALADAPDDSRHAALELLAETVPREPEHPLFEIVLGVLMGCSLDATVPTSVRYHAADVIDDLGACLFQAIPPSDST